ncbi:ras-related protein Rab-7L1, partial [Octopus sinensis]|uniref:Ras-related protein Rab-7L1 n=1 Tax=Octopus sinensis TaxID=2607531 RepID=A0A7E6F7D5_9MOLL
MSETEILLKVLIIGDPNVGKTSFVQRYINNTFRGTYKWTIGVDFGLKLIQWSPTEAVKLQLWDIAGQERYTSMTRVYYKDAFGCVVMCDITQSQTFKSAALWKKDLDSKCTLSDNSPVPCILLANKDDLPIRSVSEKDLDAFCKEHNFLAWANISVKENHMIKESMKLTD